MGSGKVGAGEDVPEMGSHSNLQVIEADEIGAPRVVLDEANDTTALLGPAPGPRWQRQEELSHRRSQGLRVGEATGGEH